MSSRAGSWDKSGYTNNPRGEDLVPGSEILRRIEMMGPGLFFIVIVVNFVVILLLLILLSNNVWPSWWKMLYTVVLRKNVV